MTEEVGHNFHFQHIGLIHFQIDDKLKNHTAGSKLFLAGDKLDPGN